MATIKSKRKPREAQEMPATKAKPDQGQLTANQRKILAKLDPGVRKSIGIFKDFAPEGNVVEEFLRERRFTTGG